MCLWSSFWETKVWVDTWQKRAQGIGMGDVGGPGRYYLFLVLFTITARVKGFIPSNYCFPSKQIFWVFKWIKCWKNIDQRDLKQCWEIEQLIWKGNSPLSEVGKPTCDHLKQSICWRCSRISWTNSHSPIAKGLCSEHQKEHTIAGTQGNFSPVIQKPSEFNDPKEWSLIFRNVWMNLENV